MSVFMAIILTAMKSHSSSCFIPSDYYVLIEIALEGMHIVVSVQTDIDGSCQEG